MIVISSIEKFMKELTECIFVVRKLYGVEWIQGRISEHIQTSLSDHCLWDFQSFEHWAKISCIILNLVTFEAQ